MWAQVLHAVLGRLFNHQNHRRRNGPGTLSPCLFFLFFYCLILVIYLVPNPGPRVPPVLDVLVFPLLLTHPDFKSGRAVNWLICWTKCVRSRKTINRGYSRTRVGNLSSGQLYVVFMAKFIFPHIQRAVSLVDSWWGKSTSFGTRAENLWNWRISMIAFSLS